MLVDKASHVLCASQFTYTITLNQEILHGIRALSSKYSNVNSLLLNIVLSLCHKSPQPNHHHFNQAKSYKLPHMADADLPIDSKPTAFESFNK